MTRLHAVVAYVLAQPIAVELSPASILSGAIGLGLALLGWSLLRHIAKLDAELAELRSDVRRARHDANNLTQRVAVAESRLDHLDRAA